MEVHAKTDVPGDAADEGPIPALRRERARLAQEAYNLSGLAYARRHADLFDSALRRVWHDAIAGAGESLGPVALVALGGYGRRELCPFSDIDLMVLHGGRRTDGVSAVSEAVFYPLWNEGFDVGHAARSVKDCLALAASEFESLTTLLDARLLAGDADLFDGLRADLERRMGKRRRGLLTQSRAAIAERREAYGEGAYVLEPNVKEGFGGLRDVHHVQWATRMLDGNGSFDDPADAGYLSVHNRDRLLEAFDWLLRVRTTLHYLAGRKTDRLFVEYQEDLAGRLGCKGVEGFSPGDHFMRDYHERSATIKHVATLFWSRVTPPRRRMTMPGRGQRIPERDRPAGKEASETGNSRDGARAAHAGVANGLALFAEAARRGRIPDPDVVESIQETLGPSRAAITWSRESRGHFLSILASRGASVDALETMNDIGLLSRLVPYWDGIRYRPSSGAYHHFTVDMHSFRAVAELSRLAEGEDDRSDLTRRLCEEVRQPDALRLATLLHDIGKGGENHAARGATLAKEICDATGLGDAELVSFLVANHLLLSVTATRRDIDEVHLIESMADRVRTVERLKMLYLLTIADSVATGPAAWNEWKAALVRELFFNVLHVLEEREGLRESPSPAASQAREEARTALASEPAADVDAFLADLPDSYLAGFSSDAVHLHFGLVHDLAAAEIRTLARPTRAGVVEFALGAPDRTGLLAKVAGVLALNSRNILAAQTYSLSNGTALQIFLTTGYFDDRPEETDWDAIAEDLKRALFGRMAIDYRLARKLAAYQRGGHFHRAAEILVDNGVTPSATVIEVHADDRIGLLYTIAKALHDLELDIRVAKVSTSADRAVDAFYVVDAHGAKIEDAAHIEEIKRGVEHQLERA